MICRTCSTDKPVTEYYRHRRSCKACCKAAMRVDHARRGADYNRDFKLQANFGLSLADVRNMLAEQGGCAICHAQTPGKSGRFWHVDHDHACCPTPGKSCGDCIRGILCHSCNLMLGHAKDNRATLRAAFAYLEAFDDHSVES